MVHPLLLVAVTTYSAATGWILNCEEQEKSVLTDKSWVKASSVRCEAPDRGTTNITGLDSTVRNGGHTEAISLRTRGQSSSGDGENGTESGKSTHSEVVVVVVEMLRN